MTVPEATDRTRDARPYLCPVCQTAYRTAEHAAGCADDHEPSRGRTIYDLIRDPTTGEPLMSVCTRGPLAEEEKTVLAALQLLRSHDRTPAQQEWLDSYLAESESSS